MCVFPCLREAAKNNLSLYHYLAMTNNEMSLTKCHFIPLC